MVGPTYALGEIKAKIASGSWFVTGTALAGAAELEFDAVDIQACVLALSEDDFYKTMPANSRPGSGLMQDVYKTNYLGTPIYLKVQENRHAVVISFKEDLSPKKGGSL